MIVCICANVSDKKIVKCLEENADVATVKDLRQHLPLCNQCCKCKREVSMILEKHRPTISITE